MHSGQNAVPASPWAWYTIASVAAGASCGPSDIRSSVIRRGRKVTASARYPVCMLPSPRSLVSVTGVKLKKSFFFLAFLAELAHPKIRCMADGRQLVEGKKGKHVFIYSAVPERR